MRNFSGHPARNKLLPRGMTLVNLFFLPCVTLQSRVGSRNGFRSGVNTGRCPGLGARSRQGGIGIIRRWFLRGRGGGQGLPPLISESQGFLRISAHPDRCFRRVPPEPPGQQQSLPPPVTEWVQSVKGTRNLWQSKLEIAGDGKIETSTRLFFNPLKSLTKTKKFINLIYLVPISLTGY
jgi:hypothetical protein